MEFWGWRSFGACILNGDKDCWAISHGLPSILDQTWISAPCTSTNGVAEKNEVWKANKSRWTLYEFLIFFPEYKIAQRMYFSMIFHFYKAYTYLLDSRIFFESFGMDKQRKIRQTKGLRFCSASFCIVAHI